MDSRILDPPHAQFGGMVGFPYHLSHHHVYELTGHQLQSAASAVPFSIDGLLNGSCAASVGNSNPLLSSGCGMNGDNQHYKLSGECTAKAADDHNTSGHAAAATLLLQNKQTTRKKGSKRTMVEGRVQDRETGENKGGVNKLRRQGGSLEASSPPDKGATEAKTMFLSGGEQRSRQIARVNTRGVFSPSASSFALTSFTVLI